jgi:hypothetical protein
LRSKIIVDGAVIAQHVAMPIAWAVVVDGSGIVGDIARIGWVVIVGGGPLPAAAPVASASKATVAAPSSRSGRLRDALESRHATAMQWLRPRAVRSDSAIS